MLSEFTYTGKDVKPTIIIPIVEWVLSRKDGAGIKAPVFANVYVIEGERVAQYRKVPWAERFLVNSSMGGTVK